VFLAAQTRRDGIEAAVLHDGMSSWIEPLIAPKEGPKSMSIFMAARL
jgi:hypothetical protein